MAPHRSDALMTSSAEVRTVTPVVSHCSTQFSTVVLPRWMTGGNTQAQGESPEREAAPEAE